MGDGTTKAIKDVKIGDFVESGDTATGTTTAQAVTDLISTQGTKQLVDVSVTAQTSNTPTASDRQHTAPVTGPTDDGHVVATDHHPFWVADQHRWLDATQLLPGMWLRTSSGTYVQVTAVHAFTRTNQTVNNLTIETTHTYYGLAGATPVLVHNSSCPVNISKGRWDHIWHRHVIREGEYPNKSKFFTTSKAKIQKMINRALDGQTRDGAYYYEVPNAIGQDGAGNPQFFIRVVARDRRLITAFPSGAPE